MVNVRQLTSLFVGLRSVFGLRFQYDWQGGRIYLQLDSTWMGSTLGLCGTLNGNLRDDFLWETKTDPLNFFLQNVLNVSQYHYVVLRLVWRTKQMCFYSPDLLQGWLKELHSCTSTPGKCLQRALALSTYPLSTPVKWTNKMVYMLILLLVQRIRYKKRLQNKCNAWFLEIHAWCWKGVLFQCFMLPSVMC